jgi:GNAT superfamily N-acetyltransferase
MDEWMISALGADHERGDFHCGESPLDSFIKDDAEPFVRLGVCRVFVLTARGDRRVVGFYASSATCVQQKEYPDKLPPGFPRFPLPAIHLGRLAVRDDSQGGGLGKLLIGHFFASVLQIAELTGVNVVDVIAKTERVKAMYLILGFRELKKNPLHLYIPVDTIRKALEPAP